MYPILLQIGPVTIFSLWFLIGIGFFAALIVINKLVKNKIGLFIKIGLSLLIGLL